MSDEQLDELASVYHIDPNDLNSSTWKIYIDDNDVQKILNMLKKHDRVYGPVIHSDPNKNFAYRHNLQILPSDYAYILHSLTLAECRQVTPYLTPSRNKGNLGNNLIVFNVDKEFTLASGQRIGHFKVYIKIDLTRTEKEGPIALISFHE